MAVRVRQSDEIKLRIEHLFWTLAACYVALVGRLVYLQAINGDYYRARAHQLRAQTIPRKAVRGPILDRNGRQLAVTVQRSVLVCDPLKVADPQKSALVAAEALNVRPEQILPFITYRQPPPGKKPNRAVVVPVEIAPERLEPFRTAKARKATSKLLAGLAIVDKQVRTYPMGRESAQVVGFLKPDKQDRMFGVAGVEKSLNATLEGTDGFTRAEVDRKRRVIPDTMQSGVAARDGLAVQLTLDSAVQHISQTELASYCEAKKPLGATAIVMDPQTGDVLAMVSYPTFDPTTRIELKTDPEALRNRALMLFEPGSTMKIITAAAALGTGAITKDKRFNCSGEAQIGNRRVRCASHGGSRAHGSETVREIIARSCNIASGQIGVLTGMPALRGYLEAFGVLDVTGVELPGDLPGTLGESGGAEDNSITKVSRVAFGQSIMVSPLAMCAAYAAIANEGQLMRPRLVKAYLDRDGQVVKSFRPEPVRQVVSPEMAAYLRSLLESVVTSGTGKGKANLAGFTVAGKTGTAQKVVKGEGGYSNSKYVASFIGFVPAKSPRAVIYVVVDEPAGEYYGAQVAAPIFQGIARKLMWLWKVQPDDPTTLARR